MNRLRRFVESEEEMRGVDKHVLLDGGLYLAIRYHVITTKHVIYIACERCKSGRELYIGEKSGINFSAIRHEHGASYGQIGSGIPEGEWQTLAVGSSLRSATVEKLYRVEYERAYKLIRRAFPEAARMKTDGDEISVFLSVPAVELFPDLKEGVVVDRLKKLLEATFKYTGDWEKDFTDEHPLLPAVVAQSVAGSVTGQDSEKLYYHLLKKFADVYKANKGWAEKILNGRGNSGRDLLYAFFKHWADAWKAKGGK